MTEFWFRLGNYKTRDNFESSINYKVLENFNVYHQDVNVSFWVSSSGYEWFACIKGAEKSQFRFAYVDSEKGLVNDNIEKRCLDTFSQPIYMRTEPPKEITQEFEIELLSNYIGL